MKLKFLRKFKRLEPENGFDLKDPRYERRTIPAPAIALVNVGPCGVCKRPLMVAIGQQIRFHRECRAEGRKRFGRAVNVVEVEQGGIVKKLNGNKT